MSTDREQQRQAAEKAFMDSLNALQDTLKSVDEKKAPSPIGTEARSPKQFGERKKSGFSLRDLEDAAADIDEFFRESQQKESNDEG